MRSKTLSSSGLEALSLKPQAKLQIKQVHLPGCSSCSAHASCDNRCILVSAPWNRHSCADDIVVHPCMAFMRCSASAQSC